jgi:ABC-type sugar transport system substrate-binding protein
MRDQEDETTTDQVSRRVFLARGGATVLAGGSLGGLLAGCGSNSESASSGSSGLKLPGNGKKQIGLSHPSSEVPAVATIEGLARKYARRMGWELLVDQTQKNNLQSQLATVSSWITQGVPAICILPVEDSALRPVMDRAQAKGLIWTNYGDPQRGSDGGVLFPPTISGRQVGAAVVKWINDNDPTAKVMIHTLSTLPSVRPRSAIPEQMIRQQTRATIVAEQDAASQADGFRVTQAALQAHPDLSVVVGLNDDGALGAVRAFSTTNKDPAKTFISGNDGSLQGLEAIRKGPWLKGTAALAVQDLAQGIVDLNIALATKPPAKGHPTNKIIPSKWITKTSPELDSYIAAWKSA